MRILSKTRRLKVLVARLLTIWHFNCLEGKRYTLLLTLIEIMSRNITSVLIRSPYNNNSWGAKQENGKYDGCLGQLQKGVSQLNS